MLMVATPVEVDGAVEVYVNQRFIVNFMVRFSTSRGCCLGLGLISRWGAKMAKYHYLAKYVVFYHYLRNI